MDVSGALLRKAPGWHSREKLLPKGEVAGAQGLDIPLPKTASPSDLFGPQDLSPPEGSDPDLYTSCTFSSFAPIKV